MDWIEFHMARQLLVEERVGRYMRADASDEDDAFAAARDALNHRG